MKCRHCRATAQSSNLLGQKVERKYLYKCERKECGRFFWHRQVLKLFNPDCPKSKKNQAIEKELCEYFRIPIRQKERSVYVIKLSRNTGETKDTVYVGETGQHPLRRYLQHLRGYKSSKHVERRGKYLLSIEKGFKTDDESKNREKELASQLEEKYFVTGGH
jgi:hypothetical protein